jgi:hypothetical protein
MNSKSVYSILRRHLRNRPDLGTGKAMLDTVLDPANPFDSRARRRWFVFFIFVADGLLCLFQRSDLRENDG